MSFSKIVQLGLILCVSVFLGREIHSLCFLGIMLIWIITQVKYKVHLLIIALIFFLMNMTTLEYSFLPQVERFVDQELSEIILANDFHMFRFLVSYPAILLGDFLDITLNESFTYYGTFYMLGCLMIFLTWIRNISYEKQKTAFLRFYVIILPIFIIIALAIHGRVASAMFAMLLILYLQIEALQDKKITLRLVMGHLSAIFLSTVSSGTFIVIFGQALLGLGLLFIVCKWKEKIRLIGGMILLSCLYLPHLLVGIEKNIDFFEGSLLNILRHGAGRIVEHLDAEFLIVLGLLSVIFLFLLCCILFVFYRYLPALIPIPLSILLGIIGGLFGFLSGTMAIPGLLAGILFLGLYNGNKVRLDSGEV